MKLSTLATLSLAVLFTSIPSSLAYYFGAGGCVAGAAGIGPPHLKAVAPTFNTQIVTGSLAVGGFKVSIDGVALKPGAVTKVAVKKSHTISVKAAASKIFRGFNFRLGITTATLVPFSKDVANIQPNYLCPSKHAVGLTHLNNNTKTVASGKLTVTSKASNVPLDVLIVVQNRNKKSIYYYSGYKLTFA